MFLRSSSSFHIPLAGLMAGAAALAGVGLMSSAVKADTVILYSTQGDFITGTNGSNFSGNNGTGGVVVSTVSTVSSPTEGGTVDGVFSATPGGSGTAGALQIALPNGLASATLASNYEVVASTSGNNFGTVTGGGTVGATVTPSAAVSALDSGGTVTLQYTIPTGTTYLNPPRFLINYPGQYEQLTGTASATADANGFYTDTISLAGLPNIAQSEQTYLQTNQYGYLNFGIILNGEVPTGSVVNIANIEVQTPAPVPEPTTIGVLALGGLGLLLVGRRRKSA